MPILRPMLIATTCDDVSAEFVRKQISGYNTLFLATLAVVLLVAEAFFTANGDLIFMPPKPDQVERAQADLDQLAVAQAIRELPPDAKIFGWGWWKAPVLALFSGREIMDFYRWRPDMIDALPRKYLVLDATVKAYAPTVAKELEGILSAANYTVMVDRPGGAIYALNKVLPYAPFTASDRDSKEIGASFNPVSGPSVAARGLYAAEGLSAWAKPDSALLLKRDAQAMFSLSIVVPPALLTVVASGEALKLDIASPGCLNASVSLRAGQQIITEQLSCAPVKEPVTMEISLHVNGHVPFIRHIDADPRRRAFQIVSAQLQ